MPGTPPSIDTWWMPGRTVHAPAPASLAPGVVAGGADAEPLAAPAPISTATAAMAASGAVRSGRAGMEVMMT